jgi:predicted O-methyltransferase YrrM
LLDPFEYKKYSKLHPIRLAFTAYARGAELFSRSVFERVQLRNLDARWPAVHDYNLEDTAVTPQQMGALLHFLGETESLSGTVVVEIGSFRGVTAAKLAQATKRMVYSVDPFIGYGGAESDYEVFSENTLALPSFHHLRETSGIAAKNWNEANISFLFIDAVHDFVNTTHDAAAWATKLVPGGILALHDTDNRIFPGTRLAAWFLAKQMELVCHIPDLTILRPPPKPIQQDRALCDYQQS